MTKVLKTLFIQLTCFVILTSLFTNCSIFISKKENNSQRDAAVESYKNGLFAYKQNDLVQAEIAFESSLQLYENFAPAYEGLARIALHKNEINRAERYLDKAIKTDKNWIPAFLLKAKIYMQKEDFDLALEELKVAYKIPALKHTNDLKNETELQIANCYFSQADFKKADSYYKKVSPDYISNQNVINKKNKAHFYANVIKDNGKNLAVILKKNAVNRADLAVLFGHFLTTNKNKQTFFIKDLPSNIIQQQAILKAVYAGWLPLLPDKTFHPNDLVDKVEMTLFIYKILKQTGFQFKKKHDLFIEDVPSYLHFEDEIRALVSNGFFTLDINSRFLPYEFVSGREALDLILHLQELLEASALPTDALRNKTPNTKNN